TAMIHVSPSVRSVLSMDKKFLSAEEAVALFGVAAADLQRLVDEGQLKALADRGSWKYRREGLEQLIKAGTLVPKSPADDEAGQKMRDLDATTDEPGSQDRAFLELDEEALAEGATMVNPKIDPASEDTTPSEVRLVTDKPAVNADVLSPGSMPVAESLSE